MTHLHTISRPRPAQTTLVETIIITLFGIFGQDFLNLPQVLQNLQKYFAKTPA